MERFSNWMEKNSHIILSVFICIQCFISSCFLILFFVEDTNEYSILVKIYSSLLLIIFTVLMVHFAYHSVSSYTYNLFIMNKINNRLIELMLLS